MCKSWSEFSWWLTTHQSASLQRLLEVSRTGIMGSRAVDSSKASLKPSQTGPWVDLRWSFICYSANGTVTSRTSNTTWDTPHILPFSPSQGDPGPRCASYQPNEAASQVGLLLGLRRHASASTYVSINGFVPRCHMLNNGKQAGWNL